ncbi:hypothetical protein [Brevibacillus formosus]|uniref:hypothetical protein n=1 Tax=Brevibacillus formosus TaxID=54913 RepID=UPI001CA484E0|nr:hypothetical protein [Brevibacillus formosus]
MASIERTAYPRFKRNPTSKELHEVYTPTSEEMQFAHSVARGSAPVMSLLVMMKRQISFLNHYIDIKARSENT